MRQGRSLALQIARSARRAIGRIGIVIVKARARSTADM